MGLAKTCIEVLAKYCPKVTDQRLRILDACLGWAIFALYLASLIVCVVDPTNISRHTKTPDGAVILYTANNKATRAPVVWRS